MQSLLQYRRLENRILERKEDEKRLAVPQEGQRKSDDHVYEVAANGDDSTEPRSWSPFHRWRAITIVWLLVFSQGWVSTCNSEATKLASRFYHVSETAQTLATALFMVGLAIGALVAGPVSETIGRNPVYLVSTFVMLCFTLGTALAPNFGAQLAFRFLAGLASSPTLSMYGGSLADLVDNDSRRSIWPVFAMSPLLGPVLAPAAGGWIVGHLPWIWTVWIALIFAGAVFLIALLFLPETFSPVLLWWKAQHLRKVMEDDRYISPIEQAEPLIPRLKTNLARPLIFFTTEPIVMSLGAYLVLIFVINFSFLNGFDFIFTQKYGLSQGITSLDFLSITVGVMIDVSLTPLYNRLVRRVIRRRCRAFVSKKNVADNSSSESEESPGREMDETVAEVVASPPPELSLIRAALASPFLPVSLYWLGWTNYPTINPASGYAATVMFGYSFSAIFISGYQYIIDSYETYSSSALGSITMARYLVAGPLIVATRPMYEGIGTHWSLTIVATLAVLLIPVPWILMRYGHHIRGKSKFAKEVG